MLDCALGAVFTATPALPLNPSEKTACALIWWQEPRLSLARFLGCRYSSPPGRGGRGGTLGVLPYPRLRGSVDNYAGNCPTARVIENESLSDTPAPNPALYPRCAMETIALYRR